MMSDATPSKSEEQEDTFFILDETGDTTILPDFLKYEPGTSAGVPGTLEESGKEDFETVDEHTSEDSQMKAGGPSKETPKTTKVRRRNKRKRQPSTTPLVAKRKKPSVGTPGKKKNPKRMRMKRKKKSVIVIGDSDTEQADSSPLPDISIVEIDDDESVIVLSDDEVGVCSGSLSTVKKPLQPLNTTSPKTTRENLAQPFIKSSPPKKVKCSPTKPPQTCDPPAKNHFEMYNPQSRQKTTGLRPIVIDGSNVAFGHGRDRFSSVGLKICVDYFKNKGHEVRAFVPQFRKTHLATTEPQILDALEKDGTLSFTPSRRTDGKMIVSYDDRFIVQYADATGGIIVSRDNYRDLLDENPEYKETIHKRLLMFTWVGDTIMFPKDPLGRGGPNLQDFLKF